MSLQLPNEGTSVSGPVNAMPTPADITGTSALAQSHKSQRVLACVLCQQRKVKCDRIFPCANCVKSKAQCVPATLLPRKRRRRLPERELLDRLHRYEELMRQNNIVFDPLQQPPARKQKSENTEADASSQDEHVDTAGHSVSTPSTAVSSKQGYAKNVWHAMSRGFRYPEDDSDSDDDDVREKEIQKVWDTVPSNDHLLFGSRTTPVDLSPLHPEPVQIFRLWQTYLDNVNPLLKVTHIPSVQGRIIEAMSNTTKIDPTFEALMFSIYCTAIMSLPVQDCQAVFGYPKDELLSKFQIGCQQALLNCNFLRSTDRDCLTALFLYLISVRPITVSPSLSAILGVAIRIALHMGINSELALSKCSIFEAEMRRRLWWSLVLFDARVLELARAKTSTLEPTWDCSIPLNVNDSDLWPDMKEPPVAQEKSTDSLFIVVRSEVGDFIRHSSLHLDFTNPALKSVSKFRKNGAIPDDDDGTAKLEQTIEDRYLRYCDEGNILQFTTIWATRAYLAKLRLLEHHAKYNDPSLRLSDTHRDEATRLALKMFECDTKAMTLPLTRGFRWLNHWYFPFPAYMQVVQDIKRRPTTELTARAWKVLNENFEAWFVSDFGGSGAFFEMLTKMVLSAWEARETAAQQTGKELMTPKVVQALRQGKGPSDSSETNQSLSNMDIDMSNVPIPPTPNTAALINDATAFGADIPSHLGMMGPQVHHSMPGAALMDLRMNYWNWGGLGAMAGWEGGF